jgi:23S rRNA (adenine2503-C2)-methyltransferase
MVNSPAAYNSVWDLSYQQLAAWVGGLGLPEYRARQIWRWLHLRSALDPQQMSDLPAELRSALKAAFDWQPLELAAKQASTDRSLKVVFRTSRGNPVEAVWMPGGAGGHAACLSSHSGCGLGCQFCETGYMGQLETLSAGQILQQLYLAESSAGSRAERVVMMGMGEPLLNLEAVRQAVGVLCDGQARAWAPRRITISTVGLVKPLYKIAETFPRINLALSLHFTQAEQRKRYMPKAEPSLEQLATALSHFRESNGGKLTLEYVLLAGLNHAEADAKKIAWLTRTITDGTGARAPGRNAPIIINLLAYNPIPSAPNFKPASEDQLNRFAQSLSDLGQTVTIRRSRGQDIGAACGQLGSTHRH